jgi:hypothetical protein
VAYRNKQKEESEGMDERKEGSKEGKEIETRERNNIKKRI